MSNDDELSDIEKKEMQIDIYELPKPKRVILPPTEQEIFKMLRLARDRYGEIPGYGHKNWDLIKRIWWGRLYELRLLIFLVTFVRISEAVMLRVEDFNLEKGWVQIYRAYIEPKKKKGEISDPTIPQMPLIKPPKRGSARIQSLGKVSCRILDTLFRELQLQQGDYILSGAEDFVKPRVIRKSHKIIAKAAGVNPESVYPHIFRSLGATLLKRHGYALTAAVLGHKDHGETVQRSYDRPYEEEKVRATRETTDKLVSKLAEDMGIQGQEDEPEQGGEKGGEHDAAAPEGEPSGGRPQ